MIDSSRLSIKQQDFLDHTIKLLLDTQGLKRESYEPDCDYGKPPTFTFVMNDDKTHFFSFSYDGSNVKTNYAPNPHDPDKTVPRTPGRPVGDPYPFIVRQCGEWLKVLKKKSELKTSPHIHGTPKVEPPKSEGHSGQIIFDRSQLRNLGIEIDKAKDETIHLPKRKKRWQDSPWFLMLVLWLSIMGIVYHFKKDDWRIPETVSNPPALTEKVEENRPTISNQTDSKGDADNSTPYQPYAIGNEWWFQLLVLPFAISVIGGLSVNYITKRVGWNK